MAQAKPLPLSAQAPPASNSSPPSSPKSNRSTTGFAARHGSRVRSRRSTLGLAGRTLNVRFNSPLLSGFVGAPFASPHSSMVSYKCSRWVVLSYLRRYRRAKEALRGGPETFAQVSQDDRVGAQPTIQVHRPGNTGAESRSRGSSRSSSSVITFDQGRYSSYGRIVRQRGYAPSSGRRPTSHRRHHTHQIRRRMVRPLLPSLYSSSATYSTSQSHHLTSRRPTPGNGYLEALLQPNVHTFTSGMLQRVTSKGFIDSEGTEHECDIFVCATGFDTSFRPRFPVVVDGVNVQERWREYPVDAVSFLVSLRGMTRAIGHMDCETFRD